MKILGIDPGTAITGYGLVRGSEDGRLELIDFGVIRTEPERPMPERLGQLHDQLMALLALHRPDSGAVEKLYYQRNVTTAMTVGQARGVCLLALAQAGVPADEYNPREVKKAVAGYGGAGKRQVQEMVRTLLAMESVPRPDDAADALAVAICHLHSLQVRRRLEENE